MVVIAAVRGSERAIDRPLSGFWTLQLMPGLRSTDEDLFLKEVGERGDPER